MSTWFRERRAVLLMGSGVTIAMSGVAWLLAGGPELPSLWAMVLGTVMFTVATLWERSINRRVATAC